MQIKARLLNSEREARQEKTSLCWGFLYSCIKSALEQKRTMKAELVLQQKLQKDGKQNQNKWKASLKKNSVITSPH